MVSISDDLLRARLNDAVHLCDKYAYPHFIGFLDERQRAVLEPIVRKIPQIHPHFYGGYALAERTFLGVFPSFYEVDETLFPFKAITFLYCEQEALCHRDVLGALLGLGIRREKIGDIRCFDGRTVVFAHEDVHTFILEQVTKIGRVGVKACDGIIGELPQAYQFKEIHLTVASARLDNIVKAVTSTAREKAAALIIGGMVAINHTPCESVCKSVCEGDILSIRGHGRFRIDALSDTTKKGRLVLIAQKYI